MSKDQGLKLYSDSDMVDATFAGEEVKIPKKWVGTEYADGYVLAEKTVDIPEGDPTDKWKVDELKAYASRESIDLGDATTKADILKVVEKPATTTAVTGQ